MHVVYGFTNEKLDSVMKYKGSLVFMSKEDAYQHLERCLDIIRSSGVTWYIYEIALDKSLDEGTYFYKGKYYLFEDYLTTRIVGEFSKDGKRIGPYSRIELICED